MFVPASPLIRLRSALAPRSATPWQGLTSRPAALFARCRFALRDGLRLLARERGLRRVWLPAWICTPVLEAVNAAGLAARWYDLDADLAPRLTTIEPDAGDGLLIVHYFGLAQPLPRLRAFCDAHGMPLIEDCAHALSDPAAAERIGAVGDIAVFSLRKQLPVAGGGLLVVRDDHLRGAVRPPAPGGLGDARELARLVLMVSERLAFAAGINLLAVKNRLPVADAAAAAERPAGAASDYDAPPPPSRLIVPMLRGVDWDALARERRRHHAIVAALLSHVADISVAIPAPAAGSAPIALLLWSSASDALARALRRRGIEAMCWPWGEQPAFDHGAYPGAARWLTQSVCLPLATPVTGRALARYVNAVAVAARESTAPAPALSA